MDILIYTRETSSSSVFEHVKDYFTEKFPDKEFEWDCSDTSLAASVQVGEKEIVGIFEELVRRYPLLDVKASFSQEVREDDRSAQWWETVKISSKEENGEKKIVRSSSVYWN